MNAGEKNAAPVGRGGIAERKKHAIDISKLHQPLENINIPECLTGPEKAVYPELFNHLVNDGMTPLEVEVLLLRAFLQSRQEEKANFKPMAELGDIEFKECVVKVRNENKGARFYLPEHLAAENNAVFEHCFLAAVLSGADPEPVRPEMFTIPKRRFIFEAMVQLRQIKALGAETLTALLRNTGKLDRCGGEAYIRELAALTLATHNIEYNARAILRFFIKRRTAA
ncbi:hypothetical protein FACS189483_02530 [Spirochaetia bacterium]|nr:hypothetical protein FACS189483_02530 [Spirochaetia bacterium]